MLHARCTHTRIGTFLLSHLRMVSVRSWAMACDVRSHTYFYAPKELVAQRPLGSNFESSELLESRLAHCYLLEVPFVFFKIMCHGRCKHWSVPSFRRAFFLYCFQLSSFFLLMLPAFCLRALRPSSFVLLKFFPASFTPRLCGFTCELYAQAMRSACELYAQATRSIFVRRNNSMVL